jgi:hypothetical protein
VAFLFMFCAFVTRFVLGLASALHVRNDYSASGPRELRISVSNASQDYKYIHSVFGALILRASNSRENKDHTTRLFHRYRTAPSASSNASSDVLTVVNGVVLVPGGNAVSTVCLLHKDRAPRMQQRERTCRIESPIHESMGGACSLDRLDERIHGVNDHSPVATGEQG